ncbi:MAG: SDR family oxidoreductase [Acidimicrobiia bacterium]|nr:SDR family oxidoreductase [Acidimicrobiia bacterium]
MTDLTGRVAVVTGGNGGIGLGMADAMARAGADIAVWGRNLDKNAAAAEQLRAHGHQVGTFVVDVGDEEQVVAAAAATVADMGKIDVMVANAGVGGGGPFVDLTLADWRRVQRVNSEGAFLSFREAARHMIERGEGGSLIGISSGTAIDGAARNQAYSHSKAGMLALVRGLSVEMARYKIRCNSIIPGWIETDMTAGAKYNEKLMATTTQRTPVRRWGLPSDLGPAAVFLADPDNAFHTGDVIVVDGGYSIF